MIPQDPIQVLLGPGVIDEARVKLLKETWKLDEPIWVQYIYYIGNFLRGNMGYSFYAGTSVSEALRERFPATCELMILGFILSLLIAIPTGIASAVHRGSKLDNFTRVFATIGVCAPSFWWGVIFLLIFYLYLGPILHQYLGLNLSSGRLSWWARAPPFITGFYTIDSLLVGRIDLFFDAIQHLILPAFTVGIRMSGLTMRLTRSSMLEVLRSDYIRTARMKGLSERVVIYKHALRNSLIPTVTYAGTLFGGLLGGSVFIETVFDLHGMGEYAVQVLFCSDMAGLLGVVFFMAIVFTTVNMIVDILYGVIDPRIRIG